MNTLTNNWWIFLFVLVIAIAYYLEDDAGHGEYMQSTLRQWLQSSRRQSQSAVASTQKQKKIAELNASASRFFRLAYLFSGNPLLPRTRLFFAIPGWTCMNFFAITVLVSMVDVQLTDFGPWGDAVFTGFVAFFCLDMFLVFIEDKFRRAQGIPVLASSRIAYALQQVAGDRRAQNVLLRKIKNVFDGAAPELPLWWNYGLSDRWLPNILQINRKALSLIMVVVLPFLFLAIKLTIDKPHDIIGQIVAIILSAILVAFVFAISWLWPFDAIQDARQWQGEDTNEPTFQMLVFWRDLEDSVSGRLL
jgi:hypothetical protein